MRQASRQRRLCLAAAAGALAVGVFAADAAGDAQVTFNSGALTIAVPSGASGDHRFFVEPFRETGGRDGWRVGSGFIGAPAITTSDSDCFGNSVFNDVVCNGQRIAVAITTREGRDNVVVNDIQGRGVEIGPFQPPGSSCITGASAFADVATVNLGGGGDRLSGSSSCPPGTDPEFGFSFHLVADGGSGNDTISGTAGADDLKGGPGADTLEGNVGDDTLDGGVNVDADVLSGGPGFDTVSYSGHVVGVTVNLDGLANDGLNQPGQPAEQDNVSSDVERVLGSARNDILFGFAGSQTLVGNGGNDTVAGGGNDDRVEGGAGNDQVFGQGGRDSIFGGVDNDNLNAQSDALADAVIDCGPGTDTAALDLQDRLTPPSTDPTTGRRLPGSSCETVSQFAVDDGPPGRALKQRLRPRPDGKVVVRIACPRRARTACRGTLTLRPVNGRRVLARGRYRVRLGRKASVSLTARRNLPRQVVAEMKEQGVSKKGPRSSSRLLRVIG